MAEIVGVRCRVFPDDIQFNSLYSGHMFDARLLLIHEKEK
jgi:hypothetical protein